MVQTIKLSNGDTLHFPDSMSDEDMHTAIQKEYNPKKDSSPKRNPASSQPESMLGELDPFGLGGKAGRTAALETAGVMIPSVRAAKYLPEAASWLTKALANFGGAIGQNSAVSAATNKLEGNSASEGAKNAAITTAAIHPIVTTLASGNPITRAIAAGSLIGGGAYGLHKQQGIGSTPTDIGAATLGAGLALRGKTAKEAALMQMLKGVNAADAEKRLNAANELGLSHLTPAEATGIPYVGANQGRLGQTSEGSELLFKKSQERLSSEQKSIDKLLDTIGRSSKLQPEIKKLYESSYNTSVEDDFLNQLKSSDIIKDAFKKVKGDSAYRDKLKGVSENNFAYLDQVKRALNDMSETASRKGQKDKARLINNKVSSLTDQMDEINPDYAKARATAQRSIVTDKLQEVLNQGQVRGSTFFNKFLKNNNKFDDLRESLKNVPNAQKQLDNMKLAFEHLINTDSARSGAKLAATSMSEQRSSTKDIVKFAQKLHGGKYDKAAIELITNPNWFKDLDRIKDLNSNNSKTQQLAGLLSKAASRGANYLSEESKN